MLPTTLSVALRAPALPEGEPALVSSFLPLRERLLYKLRSQQMLPSPEELLHHLCPQGGEGGELGADGGFCRFDLVDESGELGLQT